MKRKFLEDLGLETDAIEKIMAEAGKDVTSLKARVDDLTEQINVKDTTISEKNNKIAELEKVDVEAIKKSEYERGKTEGSKEIEVFKKLCFVYCMRVICFTNIYKFYHNFPLLLKLPQIRITRKSKPVISFISMALRPRLIAVPTQAL